MSQSSFDEPPYHKTTQASSQVLSGLGALGVALQNYQGVELFIRSLNTTGQLSAGLSQTIALGAGGVCSGMVNYRMNVKLLDGFLERMTSDKDYHYKQLTPWQQLQYFGGIVVFVVTGILFGLMAFTFAMEGPLAMLSIVAGCFVAGIMTVQEVETWLASYEQPKESDDQPLTDLQHFGKACGQMIAIGNVFALSLLFTLSLAQGLIMLQIAALPALIAGFFVAFTFGAFTEYYFYNVYLTEFCKNFAENWALMMQAPNALFGLLCISTNAFVNAALTYSGLELLSVLLVTAGVTLPPVAMMVAVSVLCSAFAGSASFILGMDFWIGEKPAKTAAIGSSALGVVSSIHQTPSGDNHLSTYSATL